MNISHEGSSIIAFRDSWPSRLEPQSEPLEPGDPDYCRARELAERAAAKRAGSVEARRVHQELAQAYPAVVAQRTSREPKSVPKS